MMQETRLRNVRKKLQQIQALEERLQVDPALELSSEQRSKLNRKQELEAELRCCLNGSTISKDEELPGGKTSTLPPTACGSMAPGVNATSDDQSLGQAVVQMPSDGASPKEAVSDGEELNQRPFFQRLTSQRWEDDPVSVEDVAPPPAASSKRRGAAAQPSDTEILEAVQPFAPMTQASERLRGLISATTDLSMEAFGTDVIEGVSRKGKWKLTLLARPSHIDTGCDPWRGLLGFLAYKLNWQVQCISIAKLAVVPEERGMGHGHRLVNWCIAMARKQATIMYLSLTSLPQAVKFYKHIGFRAVDVDLAKLDGNAKTKLDPNAEDECEYIEGQVYMEYRCRGGRGGAPKAKGKRR